MTLMIILCIKAGVYWVFGLIGVSVLGMRNFYIPHVDTLYIYTR